MRYAVVRVNPRRVYRTWRNREKAEEQRDRLIDKEVELAKDFPRDKNGKVPLREYIVEEMP